MRRTITSVLLAVVLVVALAGVVLSPVALESVAAWTEFDPKKAGELGGSYGAASALLSAVALFIIAVSTALQVQQTRLGQLHASRSLQLELLRMAIDKPEYRSALGDNFQGLTEIAWQEHAYVNLWMMYLQMAYLTGAISDTGVRRMVSEEIFKGKVGLDYWRNADPVFTAEATSRKHRSFIKIVREVFAQASLNKLLKRDSCVIVEPGELPKVSNKIFSASREHRGAVNCPRSVEGGGKLMIADSEHADLAARFRVYDHEWQYLACYVGEPHLHGDLLLYDDGTLLSLCAFSLTDANSTISWSRILEVLSTRFRHGKHQLVHIWGKFDVQPELQLDARLLLADAESLSTIYGGEYTIDLCDESLFITPVLRKVQRQIKNKNVVVQIEPSRPLCARQLRLIEVWRRTHDLSPLGVSAGQAITTFVRLGHSFTARAFINQELLGFSVFSRPNSETLVNLMSFSDRVLGGRIDDALMWNSIQFARDHGYRRFHLGYAGSNSLAQFKRKWSAVQTGPDYRDAVYIASDEWERVANTFRFSWISRLLA